MRISQALSVTLHDYHPRGDAMREEVLEGLRESRKTLPCKYFYDARGSALFDAICELPEYYLTRTELGIMETHVAEMAAALGAQVQLVEPGSGSSLKTRMLLDHLQQPVAYVPVDISREHLVDTADRLNRLYPELEVLPVCADFNQAFEVPAPRRKPRISRHGRRTICIGRRKPNGCGPPAAPPSPGLSGEPTPSSRRSFPPCRTGRKNRVRFRSGSRCDARRSGCRRSCLRGIR